MAGEIPCPWGYYYPTIWHGIWPPPAPSAPIHLVPVQAPQPWISDEDVDRIARRLKELLKPDDA